MTHLHLFRHGLRNIRNIRVGHSISLASPMEAFTYHTWPGSFTIMPQILRCRVSWLVMGSLTGHMIPRQLLFRLLITTQCTARSFMIDFSPQSATGLSLTLVQLQNVLASLTKCSGSGISTLISTTCSNVPMVPHCRPLHRKPLTKSA